MTFNWELDISSIIGLIAFVCGLLWWVYDVKATLNTLVSGREREHHDNQKKFEEIEEQLSEITKVVVELAQQKEQIKNLYSTISELKEEVKALRNGKPYTAGPVPAKRKRSS